MVIRLIGCILFVAILSACEHGSYRHDVRSPHMPIFTDLEKGESSQPSNPYWSRFTMYFDKQEMKLSSGEDFILKGPTLVGSLGTHYRTKKDIYFYAMTGGVGLQRDAFFWNEGKFSFGLLAGFNQNWGANISISQKIWTKGTKQLVGYTSAQYRGIVIDVYCINGKSPCATSSSGLVDIIIREKVANTIAGVELRGFSFGEERRTTLYFNFEMGYQWTLDSKIESESHNTLYRHDKVVPMVSANVGLTLW